MSKVITTMFLDEQFDSDFKKIFNKKQCADNLSGYISDTLLKNKGTIEYLNLINILKTTHVIGETYTFFKKKANTCVRYFDERDKFILSLVIISMANIGAPSINKYLTTKEDVLIRAVERSYLHAGYDLDDDGVMKDPSMLDFTEDVGDLVDSWDEYYYNICKQAAKNSKCYSRQIGAILVKDKVVISAGYNGPPRGVPPCDIRWGNDPSFFKKYSKYTVDKEIKGKCPRHIIGFKSGEGLEICPAGHAERNSLINAGRLGIATKDTTMYMTCGIPCSPCLVEIINSGVKEIVTVNLKFYDETAKYLLENSDLRVRVYDFVLKQ